MLRAKTETVEKNNEKDLINEWLLWKHYFAIVNYIGLCALSCLTLCDSMDCNSSDHRIFQARILGWVAIPHCRDWTRVSCVSCFGGRTLCSQCHLGSIVNYVLRLVAKSCPTLFDHMGCSPPGSSFCGTSQAGYWNVLPCPLLGNPPDPEMEPRSPALQADSLLTKLPGKPVVIYGSLQIVCCSHWWIWV